MKKQFVCYETPTLLDCGCTPAEVAANNIKHVVDGAALAVCELEPTSEGGKGAIWSLVCDKNNNGKGDDNEFTISRIEMPGTSCTFDAELSCNTEFPPFMVIHPKYIFKIISSYLSKTISKKESVHVRNISKMSRTSAVPAVTSTFAADQTGGCIE